MPTQAQIYEDHAAACTRAAEQCDDPVFRDMLISLALQWKLAAREEVAKVDAAENLTPLVEMSE